MWQERSEWQEERSRLRWELSYPKKSYILLTKCCCCTVSPLKKKKCTTSQPFFLELKSTCFFVVPGRRALYLRLIHKEPRVFQTLKHRKYDHVQVKRLNFSEAVWPSWKRRGRTRNQRPETSSEWAWESSNWTENQHWRRTYGLAWNWLHKIFLVGQLVPGGTRCTGQVVAILRIFFELLSKPFYILEDGPRKCLVYVNYSEFLNPFMRKLWKFHK